MEAMRQSWTDDRLDDFRDEVNRRFDEASAEVNQRFDDVNRRLEDGSAETHRRLDEVNGRLDKLEDRFAAMQQTIMLTGGGILATLVAGILSLIGLAVL